MKASVVERLVRLPERRLVLVVLAVCALLGVLGEVQNAGVSNTHPFDLDAEQRIAAAWTALLLTAAGVLAWLLAEAARAPHLRLLGAFLVFMAVDEFFELHEKLEKQLDVDWQLLYLPVLAVGGVALLVALRGLHRAGHAHASRLLVAGAVAWSSSQLLEVVQWDGDRQVSGYEQMTTAEELLEMVGSFLFALALLSALRAVTRPSPERASPVAR